MTWAFVAGVFLVGLGVGVMLSMLVIRLVVMAELRWREENSGDPSPNPPSSRHLSLAELGEPRSLTDGDSSGGAPRTREVHLGTGEKCWCGEAHFRHG